MWYEVDGHILHREGCVPPSKAGLLGWDAGEYGGIECEALGSGGAHHSMQRRTFEGLDGLTRTTTEIATRRTRRMMNGEQSRVVHLE